MSMPESIVETPWDSRVFGIPTFEITSLSKEVLKEIKEIPGHYTIKVDPLSSKKPLHDHGFYFCDTLLEPYCLREKFVAYEDSAVRISRSAKLEDLIAIAHGAFAHGRFHRDFNVDRNLADLRYDRWLQDLYDSGNVLGLLYNDKPAGFWGVSGNKMVLHALSKPHRGTGLAKYLWTPVCEELFNEGHQEIVSSISATNVAMLNTHTSLGFKFRKPLDIYHWFNKEPRPQDGVFRCDFIK